MADSDPQHSDAPVPATPPLPDVDSPPREDVLDGVPSKEEIVENAESAERIVEQQPSVDDVLKRPPGALDGN